AWTRHLRVFHSKGQARLNGAFGQNLTLMTSSSWRASYVFCVYEPHVFDVSSNWPTFRFSVGLSFIVAGSTVAPKEVLSPGLNCVLLNRFVACAARLTEYRSRILKDFSIDIFTFQMALLRISPKVAADVPYQKRSGTTVPFGVITVRPAKAS